MSGAVKSAVIQTSLGSGMATGMYASSKDKNALAKDLVNVGAWEGLEFGLKTSLARKTASTAIGKVSEQVGKTIVTQTTVATKGATAAASLGASSSSLSLGPVGVAIMAVQFGGILIDLIADPYYSYDNKMLKEIKNKYENAIKEVLQEMNISYPVKAVVSTVSYDTEGNIKLDQETLQYFQEYLDKNGLYLKDETEDLAVIAKNIRTSRLFQLSSNTDPMIFTQLDNNMQYTNYLYTSAALLLVKGIENKRKNNEYKKQRLQFYTIMLIYIVIVYIFVSQLLN
jgi:hypothetical protein